MLPAIAIQVPLLVAPLLPVPQPTRDCRLEVLTPQALEEQTFDEFNRAIDRYVTLHRRMARSLATPRAFDDEDLFRTDELRAALLAARPQARPGTFFTAHTAMRLRERIDDAFLNHPGAAADAITRRGYAPLPGEPGPVVNQPFPAVVAGAQWLPLIRALPPLPRELDFALWGRDLVLVDVAANLVLDACSPTRCRRRRIPASFTPSYRGAAAERPLRAVGSGHHYCFQAAARW
jgi:hypothetical protein